MSATHIRERKLYVNLIYCHVYIWMLKVNKIWQSSTISKRLHLPYIRIWIILVCIFSLTLLKLQTARMQMRQKSFWSEIVRYLIMHATTNTARSVMSDSQTNDSCKLALFNEWERKIHETDWWVSVLIQSHSVSESISAHRVYNWLTEYRLIALWDLHQSF